MDQKIIGYILVAIGLAVIIFSAFSVYNVFTKKARPIELFHFDSVSISATALMSPDMAAKIPAGQEVPKIDILPADMINPTTNILAHLFLMGFMVSIGYRVSMLGVQILRPVVVKVGNGKIERALDGQKAANPK